MFLITPKGEGQYICEELEDKYFDIALTGSMSILWTII